MKRHVMRMLSGAVVLLVVLTGCPFPLDHSKEAIGVWGRVDLDAPVVGATVVIHEVVSGESLWQGETLDGHFFEHLSAETFPAMGKDLLFSASGGTVAGKAFSGTLQAYVPAYVASDHIEVNLVTTLIAQYVLAWGVPYETARQEVFDYLKIPQRFVFLDETHHANNRLYFDSERFLQRAEAFGGLDAYVDYLVADEIGLREGESFGGLYGVEREAAEKSLATDMGAALGKSIMSAVGTKVAGLVLSYFGFQGTDDQLTDINTKLDTMNTKLDEITTDLAALQSTVDAVLATVVLSRDQIIGQIAGYNIALPQSVINNQYDNLMQAFTTDSPDIHTSKGQSNAFKYAEDILSASGYDIDQKLVDLHNGIVGGTVGTTGFLDACTDVTIGQAAGGRDILDAYLVLECYFSELIAVQGKGLILMTEALNFEQAYPQGAGKRFPGTAAQFLTKFQGNIAVQVEKFLTCVDRLVVSKFNVVTDLAAPVQVVPNNAGTVYKRADFLAYLLNPLKHPAGFVLRAIGTPTDLRNLVTAGAYTNDKTTWSECPFKAGPSDAAGAKAGGGCSGSTHLTTTATYYVGVNVNGNPINAYPAVLPSDHTLGQYYEWSSSASAITYRLQSQVSVAKFVLGTTSHTTSSSTCRDCGSIKAAPAGANQSWTLEPGLQNALSGTAAQCLVEYTDAFEVTSSNGTPYANVLVVLRKFPAPSAWATSQAWLDPSGGNLMSATFDPNSMKAAAMITLSKLNYYSNPYDYSDTYYYWTVYNNIVTSANFSPATTADAVGKMAIGAQATLGYTTSYAKTIGLNGNLTQWTSLGSQSTAKTTCNVVNSGTPSTTDTGMQTVSAPLPAGANTVVSLSHQILDGTNYHAGGPINLDSNVAYSHFRIYPVSP